MALNSLFCADVPLSNHSLTASSSAVAIERTMNCAADVRSSHEFCRVASTGQEFVREQDETARRSVRRHQDRFPV